MSFGTYFKIGFAFTMGSIFAATIAWGSFIAISSYRLNKATEAELSRQRILQNIKAAEEQRQQQITAEKNAEEALRMKQTAAEYAAKKAEFQRRNRGNEMRANELAQLRESCTNAHEIMRTSGTRAAAEQADKVCSAYESALSNSAETPTTSPLPIH